jgi:PhzF family phenazine biosynthesis protein
MQEIAQRWLSETAFLLPPTATGADLRLRWFTPASEVPLCGHATIATFNAVAEERLHGTGEQARKNFRVETRSGILPVLVERGTRGTTVHFGLPIPRFQPGHHHCDAVLAMLRLNGRDLHPALPILSDKYLYVPVVDRRYCSGASDFSAIDAFAHHHFGICRTTLTPWTGSRRCIRGFLSGRRHHENPLPALRTARSACRGTGLAEVDIGGNRTRGDGFYHGNAAAIV